MGHLLSQREAARAWGVGRATIQRAISAGEISVTTEKLIDAAEMVRKFGEPKRPNQPASGRTSIPPDATPEPPHTDPAQAARIAVLEAELAGLKATLLAKDGHIEDLRSQVRLLAHDGHKNADVKRRWWQIK